MAWTMRNDDFPLRAGEWWRHWSVLIRVSHFRGIPVFHNSATVKWVSITKK